ncbi:MAG: methyltransferase domain-containing protein, partial [Caldimonas sp.]
MTHFDRQRRRLTLKTLMTLLPITAAMPSRAQAAPTTAEGIGASGPSGYSSAPRSADGIGKRYMGREIAGVMGWQGAAWLEREEREREERTDLLMQALALKPGMVVGDIGAGTGYLSRRMAAAVAPGGKVLAQDVQPEMIAMLRKLASQQGL